MHKRELVQQSMSSDSVVEVFVTRPGKHGVELLCSGPLTDEKTGAINPSMVGVMLPGEHPCETAWRLASLVTGCDDACISFHRLSGLTPVRNNLGTFLHSFHTMVEEGHEGYLDKSQNNSVTCSWLLLPEAFNLGSLR